MRPDGLIFDFDGVLLESEWVSNRHLADLLTELGHPTSVDHALTNFTGLSGPAFLDAVERHIGRPVPDEFHHQRREEDLRALRHGLEAVAGAVGFVRSLDPALPKAIASSSTTHWIRTHLDHLGLRQTFAPHIYSGHEHVANGKPAPDIYLHAAGQIGIPIEKCAIIEDSEIGVSGAVASGARVIGLVAGRHCADGHEERLRALGVKEIAGSFDEIGELLDLR
ncbi:HAD family phosphatase [Sphingomonas piscis]|uniref:HAD family phosphatase n=1 Tax=Sphingomonas piscis TaxID=2714943 RepID=A0A6G7YPM3_9SPHN|nr:HAD family phosphatase [Sphingomonas piscis]QIK78689.1 HAD family phosphatase [Sphingomonas piscis]